jgi:hypothetical protein
MTDNQDQKFKGVGTFPVRAFAPGVRATSTHDQTTLLCGTGALGYNEGNQAQVKGEKHMAYGRLDVFWPDGQFKTFALVENAVSVGRSSGNTLALDTNTISRYHLSITHDGQHVFVTDLDSANGTFVDGVRLKPNEARPLGGGEDIQIGHLRLIYHQIDEMPTQPMKAVEEITQRIETTALDFRVEMVGPDQPFSPGAHMSAEVAITNTAATARRFQVKAEGMPAEWIRIDRSELELDAGETATVQMNFRPLRRPQSRPGDYSVLVRVFPSDRPDLWQEGHIPVRILPYNGFGVALENDTIQRGESFRLHIHNQGSGILPLVVSAVDRSGALRCTLSPAQASLGPDQRVIVRGQCKPTRRRWLGNEQTLSFDVQVRSTDAAAFLAAVRGAYVDRPLIPRWSAYMLGGLGLAAAALLVIFVILILRPAPQPVINSFTVSSTLVAQSTPIEMYWSVQNVEHLSVQVNGTPFISGIGPDSVGGRIDTKTLSGDVRVSLVGENGDLQASASQSIQVYQGLGEGTFTVEPTQLVRYVVQSLRVQWDVPGAVTTRLSGLESFSNLPQQQTSFGASGEITGVAGIPRDNLKLTLFAQDEMGNTREQTIQIPIINPECVPAGPQIVLYAGPDARYQVVGTVPAGAFIVVDAQDSSGQWLRAQLPGGLAGWGVRAEFSCAQTFNVGDLVKELNVPQMPPASPTPTAAPPTVSPAPTGTTAPPRSVGTFTPTPTTAG